jgi:hypothetical protein
VTLQKVRPHVIPLSKTRVQAKHRSLDLSRLGGLCISNTNGRCTHLEIHCILFDLNPSYARYIPHTRSFHHILPELPFQTRILNMEPLYSKSTKQPRIVLQRHTQQDPPHRGPSPSLLGYLSKLLPARQPPPDFPTFLRRLLIILTCGTLGLLYLHYSDNVPNPEFHPGHAGSNVFGEAIPISNNQILNVISCSEQANSTDPCLVERPAGVIILAQMYDRDLGMANIWGTHGLWPNFCDGTNAQRSTIPFSRKITDDPLQARIQQTAHRNGSSRMSRRC